MPKAIWNDVTIAEASISDVKTVEGNIYFPRQAVKSEFLKESATHSTCLWKGTASYYSIAIGDKTNPDAAWYYPKPKPEAAQIKDHIAFWKGVKIES